MINRELLSKGRTKIMYWKTYMSRAIGYASIMNSGMLLFLFLSKLKETGWISFDIDAYFLPIFFMTFVILITIGWIEVKFLKGIQEEASIGFALTPPMVEMKEKLDYMYDKLKKEEEEKNEQRGVK
jgi:hypothetical protein